MRRSARNLLLAVVLGLALGAAAAHAQQVPAQPKSDGHPHKWQAVEKSMIDFINDGFELKTVVYESVETGAKTDVPDVHYFLQKKAQLVRCDFRKRAETSYYWCNMLVKPK